MLWYKSSLVTHILLQQTKHIHISSILSPFLPRSLHELFVTTSSATTMSLSTIFYEPFYSLSDFDRLFDEAFSARTNASGQVQRHGQGDNAARVMRPR